MFSYVKKSSFLHQKIKNVDLDRGIFGTCYTKCLLLFWVISQTFVSCHNENLSHKQELQIGKRVQIFATPNSIVSMVAIAPSMGGGYDGGNGGGGILLYPD